jgi:hypothetical protein
VPPARHNSRVKTGIAWCQEAQRELRRHHGQTRGGFIQASGSVSA